MNDDGALFFKKKDGEPPSEKDYGDEYDLTTYSGAMRSLKKLKPNKLKLSVSPNLLGAPIGGGPGGPDFQMFSSALPYARLAFTGASDVRGEAYIGGENSEPGEKPKRGHEKKQRFELGELKRAEPLGSDSEET